MKFIRTRFFKNQIQKLEKKYRKIKKDIDFFEENLSQEPFSDLGNNFYKYRIRNSSIPVGKRGGFRMIVKRHNEVSLPILLYSKVQKDNVTKKEIIEGLEKVLGEL